VLYGKLAVAKYAQAVTIKAMNISDTRDIYPANAETNTGLVAAVRAYFWWYGFGYFSQQSGAAS